MLYLCDLSSTHTQFKGKSDVIESPPGCLLRKQTAFHKLINIWVYCQARPSIIMMCTHMKKNLHLSVVLRWWTYWLPWNISRDKERMPEQQPLRSRLPWLLAIGKYQRIVHSARQMGTQCVPSSKSPEDILKGLWLNCKAVVQNI